VGTLRHTHYNAASAYWYIVHIVIVITVGLQCYRRQAIPTEQGKIRPSVTLYSLDRSLSNLVRLITPATPTRTPILVEFGWVGNSPRITSLWLFAVSFFVHTPRATRSSATAKNTARPSCYLVAGGDSLRISP